MQTSICCPEFESRELSWRYDLRIWIAALWIAWAAIGQDGGQDDALRRLQRKLTWTRGFELRLAVEVRTPPFRIKPSVLSRLYGPVPDDPARRAARALAMAEAARQLSRRGRKNYVLSARLAPDGRYWVSIRERDDCLHECAFDGHAYWERMRTGLVSPYRGKVTIERIEDVIARRGDPRSNAAYACRLRYVLNVFCLVPDAIRLALRSGAARLDEVKPGELEIDLTLPWPRRNLGYTNAMRVRAVFSGERRESGKNKRKRREGRFLASPSAMLPLLLRLMNGLRSDEKQVHIFFRH